MPDRSRIGRMNAVDEAEAEAQAPPPQETR